MEEFTRSKRDVRFPVAGQLTEGAKGTEESSSEGRNTISRTDVKLSKRTGPDLTTKGNQCRGLIDSALQKSCRRERKDEEDGKNTHPSQSSSPSSSPPIVRLPLHLLLRSRHRCHLLGHPPPQILGPFASAEPFSLSLNFQNGNLDGNPERLQAQSGAIKYREVGLGARWSFCAAHWWRIRRTESAAGAEVWRFFCGWSVCFASAMLEVLRNTKDSGHTGYTRPSLRSGKLTLRSSYKVYSWKEMHSAKCDILVVEET